MLAIDFVQQADRPAVGVSPCPKRPPWQGSQRLTAASPDRRRFLTAGAAVLGAAASAQLWLPGTARAAGTPLPDGVFTLGVSSGDPLPDGIVLWTRLAPDPLNGGGMPDRVVPVEWEVEIGRA